MNDEFKAALATLAERLVLLSERDGELRTALRALAGAVLAATEHPSATIATVEPEPEPEPAEQQAPEPTPSPPAPAVVIEPARPVQPLPALTLGQARPLGPTLAPRHEAPSAVLTSGAASTDADLPAIEDRCRLKAEGARWALTRRRLQDEGADHQTEIAPRDREILDRAGAMDRCYMWMNTPEFTVPRDSTQLDDVAGWFEVVADAIALIREMLPDVEANRSHFEPALDLLAEAQSALRVAVERVGGSEDSDQYRAYDWLRGTAERERIYIKRHMRLYDPADPSSLPAVGRRLEALDERFQKERERGKKKRSIFSRLRYHAKLIGKGGGNPHDWRKVVEAIDELVGERVPPSSVEIRETLLPILDEMPDLADPPASLGLVLREIDGYLASRPPEAAAVVVETPIPQVTEAARLLAGKSVLLIGGVRRPGAHKALQAAFGLEELIWPDTREHESIERFRPIVARPEVALVLLAIRWSSHSFSEVRQFCDQHGKPMVRLPGGYGVNQVAAQVIEQCGDRLGAGGEP